LDQPKESPDQPDWQHSTAEVRLLRLRLRLALLTMAVVPMLLVFGLAGSSLESFAVGHGLPVVPIAVVVALSALLIALAVWVSRQVLKPAEELARSRAEVHRLYEVAKADSLRDPLTGLGNYRAFQEELDRQLEWYRRYKVPVALLLLDIDDIKLLNEAEGHLAGDELLREIGRLIGHVARYADRSFRIGGDEFALLMPHTDAEGAVQLAHRLLDFATQQRASGRAVSFSGGISACPAMATTRSQLYAQAGAALNWCKRHGRSTIDIFDPVRDRDADRQASGTIAAAISRVITQGMLSAAYQPIVELSSGVVIGFEGLIRPHADSGFSDPSTMVAAAESVGRSVELDHACIQTIVRESRGLGAHQLLSINVSPRFLEAPQFTPEWVLGVVRDGGIEPTRLIVELTERENVEDVVRLQRNLAALQRAGVRIAADDVGAGNAGLRLLSQFRFDIVKLDLTLVHDGAQRDSSRAVLRSLRELASRWGAYTIAEGLETVSQLRSVREIGVGAGQGYLFSRPMPSPTMNNVDMNLIEAGGAVLAAPPPPPPPRLVHGTDFAPAPAP